MAMMCLVGAAACQRPPGNLSDPADFNTAIHALRTDLTKAHLDLHHELRLEARLGANGKAGEPSCYSLKNNVNFVALKTIRNFIVRTVSSDRNDVQIDLNHIRHDRSDFKKDLADFLNDGVARPHGARHAIEQITAKIILSKARANRLISKINSAVHSAYSTGNALAAEAPKCFGAGPGSQIPSVALVT
jgi:hypothetical protein